MQLDTKEPQVLEYGPPILKPEEETCKQLIRRIWITLFVIVCCIVAVVALFFAAFVLIDILNFVRAVLGTLPLGAVALTLTESCHTDPAGEDTGGTSYVLRRLT